MMSMPLATTMPRNAGASAPPGAHEFGAAYSSYGNGIGVGPFTPVSAPDGAAAFLPYTSYNSYPAQSAFGQGQWWDTHPSVMSDNWRDVRSAPSRGAEQELRQQQLQKRPGPMARRPPPPPGLWQAAPKRAPVVIGSAKAGIATGSRYDALGTP